MTERRLKKRVAFDNKRPLWQCGPCDSGISSECGREKVRKRSQIWKGKKCHMKKKRIIEDSDAGTSMTPNRNNIGRLGGRDTQGTSHDLTSVIPAITSRRAWNNSEYGVNPG